MTVYLYFSINLLAMYNQLPLSYCVNFRGAFLVVNDAICSRWCENCWMLSPSLLYLL